MIDLLFKATKVHVAGRGLHTTNLNYNFWIVNIFKMLESGLAPKYHKNVCSRHNFCQRSDVPLHSPLVVALDLM